MLTISRWISRAALVPLLLFAAAMALIHLQPDRSADVHAILGPNASCAAPCFLGIQPKLTTSDQAVERLRASGWADSIQQTDNAINWNWSGRQSALIDDSVPGRIVIAVSGTVAYINLRTRIRASDLWLTYGVPQRGFVAFRRDDMIHIVSYPEQRFDATVVTDCPAAHLGFWYSETVIYWGITVSSADTDTSYAREWRRNLTC